MKNTINRMLFISLGIVVVLITLSILFYFRQFLVFVYIIFLFLFSIYSWAAIYHLKNYGYKGDACQLVIYLYSFICAAIVLFSLFLLFA